MYELDGGFQMFDVKDIVYNDKLKEAWFESYREKTDIDELYISKCIIPVFRTAKETETTLNKDLSNFTLPEILILLKSYDSASVTSVRNRASLFRLYTDFAISKHFSIDGQNHYNELDMNIYKDCINKRMAKVKFFDEDAVQEMLDKLPNARDQYLILAPWEGICGKLYKELTMLREEDLDEDNNIVHLCTDRTVKVSNELMAIMQDAGSTDVYISSDGKQRKLSHTDLIYKPLDSTSAKPVDTDVLTRRMSKMKVFLEAPALGFNMLRVSGFCYRLAKLVLKKGVSVDELYSSKDSEYVELVKQYDFVKKGKAEIRYMYDEYVAALPRVLEVSE